MVDKGFEVSALRSISLSKLARPAETDRRAHTGAIATGSQSLNKRPGTSRRASDDICYCIGRFAQSVPREIPSQLISIAGHCGHRCGAVTNWTAGKSRYVVGDTGIARGLEGGVRLALRGAE